MMGTGSDCPIQTGTTRIAWERSSRVALVRYELGASLLAKDAGDLVEALVRFIGDTDQPFAVLADATGLRATDGEYRAAASRFFRQHRDKAFIALVGPEPKIQIVVEMFRLGTGIQLKVFKDEPSGRAWSRTKGIAA
jgi:hypothetical protein